MVGVCLALLLSACAADPAPIDPSVSGRAVTTAEAEQLAMVRFRNFEREVVPVRIVLHVDGQDLRIEGDVDMREHRGYATFVATGAESSAGLIHWTVEDVALLPNGASEPTVPPPAQGWTVRRLDPGRSRLDAALALTVNLAADRPENPLLLQRNGATHLDSTTLRGHRVEVFRGPAGPASVDESRLTYFVDESGLLHRVVADLAGGQGPLTIDLLEGEGAPVPLLSPPDHPEYSTEGDLQSPRQP